MKVFNRKLVEESIAALILGLGLDDKEDGLSETPARVAKFYQEYCQPKTAEELEKLLKTFEHSDSSKSTNPMVVQTNIPFKGLCEHHLLPFVGKACIGYIPGKRIVGLSKLTRLVSVLGTLRPSVQERITDDIADTLADVLDCRGVIVVAKAEHTCMSIRGANAPDVVTSTSAVRGVFRDVTAARQEFFNLLEWSS